MKSILVATRLIAAVALCTQVFCVSAAHAEEKIGTLSINDVRMRATYFSQEEKGGSFDLGNSAFGVLWRKDRHWSAHFTIGDQAYRNMPIYYSNTNPSQLGLVDAYAEYNGVYGRVRAGLIPIDFGYDGTLNEVHRYFQYSQSFSRRLIALSDEGVSFYTEHDGYFTELVIHNGSIDQANDGNPWLTGNWGWSNSRNLKVQLSLQTGVVSADLTTNSTNTIAGFQPGITSRWRNGALFAEYTPLDWNVVGEIGGGEMVQNDETGRYDYQLLQVSRDLSRNWTVGTRYDFFDPNMAIGGDAETDLSVVVALKSDDDTSKLLLEGTAPLQQTHQVHDDQLRLVWLLTPFAH